MLTFFISGSKLDLTMGGEEMNIRFWKFTALGLHWAAQLIDESVQHTVFCGTRKVMFEEWTPGQSRTVRHF